MYDIIALTMAAIFPTMLLIGFTAYIIALHDLTQRSLRHVGMLRLLAVRVAATPPMIF